MENFQHGRQPDETIKVAAGSWRNGQKIPLRGGWEQTEESENPKLAVLTVK